jgi:hypothetical protein
MCDMCAKACVCDKCVVYIFNVMTHSMCNTVFQLIFVYV